MNKVHDFPEHEKEIDDIDFSPDSAKVASISKDKRAIIWDVKKGKKHAELGWDPPGGIKYLFKRVKFACVEGDHKKYKGKITLQEYHASFHWSFILNSFHNNESHGFHKSPSSASTMGYAVIHRRRIH